MIEIGKVLQFIPFVGLMANHETSNSTKSARVLEILIIMVVMGYTSLKIAEGKIESLETQQKQTNRIYEERLNRLEGKINWLIRNRIEKNASSI